MLSEQGDLHSKSKWSSSKKKLDEDERYKNKYLDSSIREQIFRDYISSLPVETISVNFIFFIKNKG